jgi:DNA topoisomerase-2
MSTIEEKYQKLSQREHILLRSGMYIGSVKKQMEELWVAKETEDGVLKMEKTMIEYSPGFMKIFDEVLTNATDHSFRDSNVTTIKVDYSKETGEISVWNNGSGIPVQLHKEHNIYVPELIFGNLLSGSNYDDSSVRTGAGTNGLGSKCILHTTLVPLFNGETKKAYEINIGDFLIGDDGTPRKVVNKISGFGEMYKIIQNYGEEYVVNNNHTLTLHMPDHKVIFWNGNGWNALWWNNEEKCIKSKFIKVFNKEIVCPECKIKLNSNLKRHYKRQHKDKEVPKYNRKSPTYGDFKNPIVKEKYNEIKKFLDDIPFESIFDINIQDYLNLNKTTQRRLAGVRANYVQWEEKEVELDPYILGLWLGDGMKHGRSYACDGNNDTEIINYIHEWCEKNDAIIQQANYNKYKYSFHSNSNFGKKNSSPLRNILKKYNLIDNKHIPKDYLINSRNNRLKLLAGLIDTDGTVMRDGTRIVITQSHIHKNLIDDIIYLVRSLGFLCCSSSYMAKYKINNGEERESLAYHINISGNIDDIPTVLPRKKCTNTKKQNTDKSTGFIKIEKCNDDTYIGFEIDGNQRFVINDFTVTHNCTNIYSKKFIVETLDSDTKKKFIQEFSDNMINKSKPKITTNSGKSYTKITFLPDYSRFEMNGLEEDTILLIRKRVLDCIACTNNNVQIYLNGEKLKGKGLIDYTKYFFEGEKVMTESHIEKFKNKKGEVTEYIWEYAIVPYTQFEQVSFVNGNSTIQGGKHVDYILYQIINKLKKILEDKKKLKELKPNFIKDKLFLFLRATVANPSFNSQTKEQLTTPSKDFGCSITVSDQFITKLYKSSITEEIVEFCKLKESASLSKNTDGKKANKIYIPKLEDAIWAGTARSNQCTLILTEGDSAKTFAMWGRSIVGPEKYGVFPLKGKCLNIRDASISQLINNEEINNLKQIIGLKQDRVYKDVSDLRYGKIMLLTDSDVDGSHIKSLLVNMFHYWWPSLIKMDYIQTLKTPIVKAIKGKQVMEFYTEQDYLKWKATGINLNSYQIRYFKGLGTSKKEDAKDTFKRLTELQVDYYYKDKKCDEAILLAFDKDKNTKTSSKKTESETDDTLGIMKCSDKRKKWLSNYDKNIYLDVKDKKVSYQDLINKELIHFSIYDNLRSIPSLCDGLKPSQRKILYYMLSKNKKDLIKVAQLAGYVSAETAYHHGEASLQGAIINMAQDFVGSNNINLLVPDGNHGSRLQCGKDAASPRYIFTKLSDTTDKIFNPNDTPLLEFLNDDGMQIEPEWYLPIIPMILVNGCEGIGTGYSTYIPSFNPKEIIYHLIKMIDDENYTPTILNPYFKGFNGTVIEIDKGSYVTKGKWERLSNKQIKITEIPVGLGVTNYKEFLESLIDTTNKKPNDKSSKPKKKRFELKDVQNHTKDENDDILFIVEFKNENDLNDLIKNNTLEKELKLVKSFSTNNMYLFNEKLILTKYNTPIDILLEFFDIRIEYYIKRKEYIIKKLQRELLILESKAKFIKEYIEGNLDINKKSKEHIVNLLKNKKYPLDDNSYDYLLRLPIYSLTLEKINDLNSQCEKKTNELNFINSKSPEELWKIDLQELLAKI